MLLALLTFLVIFGVCFGVLMLFVRGGRNRDQDAAGAQGRRPLVLGILTEPLAGMTPLQPEAAERITRFLRQAGHYHAQSLTEYLALRNALVASAVLLTVAAIVVISQPGELAMFAIAGAGLLAVILLFALPRLVLESMAKGRTRRIEESLPDAMDMITMCTSAGLPLERAISRVSEEMGPSHPDLAFELRIVGRHTQVGSLNSAIQQFAKRVDVPEVHSVAAMVWQAEQQGGGVAEAFQAFSDQVRLNQRQRAEEAGNKAAFKMLFPLVFCLAPAVYLVLLGPAVMDLREFFLRETQPGGALSASPADIESATSQPALTPPPSSPPPSGILANPGSP